nr:apoptosis inhibitor 5-like protein API5 isoform X1 [Tanacetum cinerariifolium]
RGASSSKFLNYLNKNIIPVFDQVSDGDHIDRLILCIYMALPYFLRGASSSKFLNYLNKNIAWCNLLLCSSVYIAQTSSINYTESAESSVFSELLQVTLVYSFF